MGGRAVLIYIYPAPKTLIPRSYEHYPMHITRLHIDVSFISLSMVVEFVCHYTNIFISIWCKPKLHLLTVPPARVGPGGRSNWPPLGCVAPHLPALSRLVP